VDTTLAPKHEPADVALHESIVEHLEISHYISVFNGSSGRVRYVVFIIIVFSIAMLVAQWNTTAPSWVSRRYEFWRRLDAELARLPQAEADRRVVEKTRRRILTREELHELLSEYRKQRVERVSIAELPGLGVHFDINDLGLFSGIAYILLLTLLLFCLMREYENLYLALFKVRRLHLRTGATGGGESAANFLYHALAMGQVFASPPTLAQWKPHPLKKATHYFVFMVPIVVQGYIVLANYATVGIALSYGAAATVMIPQYVLLAGIITLSALALMYEEAANRRWHSAFYFINPALRHVARPPWRSWLKRPAEPIADPLRRHLSAQMLEYLTISSEPSNDKVEVEYALPLVGTSITRADIGTMGRELESLATKAAHQKCSHFRLMSVQVISSSLEDNVWEVKAQWRIHCDPLMDAPKAQT
jgi:hypothetical protein